MRDSKELGGFLKALIMTISNQIAETGPEVGKYSNSKLYNEPLSIA
jgi:hypothetical protein